VLVGTGSEALDRCNDHLRIQCLDPLPGAAHAVERTRSEVLHQDVAMLDQPFEHFLALRTLRVEGHRTLVVVQHREIETVHARNVAQLFPSDVPGARPLDLDYVRAEPSQQLSTRRSRLHMREVENTNSIQCLTHSMTPDDYHLYIV